MKKFILVFGLGGFGGHYDALAKRLMALGAEPNGRIAWTLSTEEGEEVLRADLSRYLHQSDEVVLAELASAA
ncbi:MAG TPA: hypothetical protein VMD76_02095 [Candidatus Sulfotelmatobacter sp.]|nr:hypothetical protein [Candidatus Sulfotelmatobacter sp.]